MIALFTPAVPPSSAAHYRSRAIFLLAAAGLVMTAHVVDLLQAGGPCWPAFALRALWAVVLAVDAEAVLRMRGSMSWLSGLNALATAVLYLALIVVTGGSASVLFVFVYPLAMVILVLLPEMFAAAATGACVLVAGAFGLLLRDGASARTLLAWAHVSVVSLLVGAVVSRAALRTRIALDRETHAREATVAALEEALQNVKTLSGLLPICMHCKRIRDDQGRWERVERYLATRTDASFTHGLCPECLDEHYPAPAQSTPRGT
jgi:hypothetical protein